MLKYLIIGTESMITTAIILGMMFAYIYTVYGRPGRRILGFGVLLGILAAIVMAYFKNKTKLIDTGLWNIYIYCAFLTALLLFMILDIKRFWTKAQKALGIVVPVLAAIMAFLLLFYVLPDVIAYPYTIVLGGEAVMSTGFLYRIIGLALSILLCLLAVFASNYVSKQIESFGEGLLLKLTLVVSALHIITKILQKLLARRIIRGHFLFQLVKFTSNHSKLFIFATLAIAFVPPLVLWIRSLHVQEPYSNPAGRRKIYAKWRSIRRWSTASVLTIVGSVVILTAVDAYANAPVELSPTEECELRGDNLYIPFEQVGDGHLHRFAYTTDNKVPVRFIIIKKPNSSSYGVGLDACDICGETGYYERGGQVVCNRCDVVMNINTIGFKGGCNPKIIDYSIENGYIIVPTYTLIEHEADFK